MKKYIAVILLVLTFIISACDPDGDGIPGRNDGRIENNTNQSAIIFIPVVEDEE